MLLSGRFEKKLGSSSMSKLMNRIEMWSAFVLMAATSTVLQAEFTDEIGRGGSVFQTSIELGANYTDNFYYSSNPGHNVFGLVAAPELAYAYILPRFKFVASGSAEAAGFNLPGNEDNYLDGTGKVGMEWQSAERHRFTYGSEVQFAHDPFGTERTAGSSTQNATIDRWRRFGAGANYYYGLPTDLFNLETSLKADHKQYTSNETITKFLDYSSVLGDVTFLYNHSPKTAFLLDLSGTRTGFDQATSSGLDSTELHSLIGMRWLATAKTNADIRVGYQSRRPRNSNQQTFNSVNWRADIRWAPVSNRAFTLQTGRSSQESYLVNVFSFLDIRHISMEWAEEWAPRLTTKAAVAYSQSRFIGFSRVDDDYLATVGADYKATEYTTLLGNIGYGVRNSNIANLDYNRLTSYIGIKFTR